MGYKTPNVVKEVYLPISDTTDIASYKETYGIDLEDIFGKVGETIKDLSNIKIYFVSEFSVPTVVCPANFRYTDDSEEFTVYCSIVQYQSGEPKNNRLGIVIGMGSDYVIRNYNSFYEEA